MKKFYFLLLTLGLFTSVNAQIINFPDANFKAKLLAANEFNNIASVETPVDNYGDSFFTVTTYNSVDTNNDGEIQVSEAINVKYLNIDTSDSNEILDVTGIENFSNLIYFDCGNNLLNNLNLLALTNLQYLDCNNNQLTILNLSNLTNLKRVICYDNQLTSLNLSNLNNLQGLDCSFNKLGSLNLFDFPNFKYLYCNNNNLTSLDLSNNTLLRDLFCGHNLMSNLNLSQNGSLVQMHCEYNQLEDLQFNNHPYLADIVCGGNQLSNFNISNSPDLEILEIGYNNLISLDVSCAKNKLNFVECSHNQLQTLIIKNGFNDSYNVYFDENPNLRYVCADESEFDFIQTQLNQLGYTNCNVNSYCSFTPGGQFYTIQGTNKFGSNNNNDCDVSDLSLPNLKFNITDGTKSGSVVSDTLGNYIIPVQAGTHTITPVFENPTYFTVSQTSVNVTFPTQASPFTQDFCVTANGTHSDVEVNLLSLEAARPGFDTKYKLVYKNKGNQIENGSVNVNFNDAVLDLVTSNPVATTVANNLSWSYANLQPFETREITFTLNVNSPMETPAVNNGDILNYVATITSVNNDEIPNDNTFAFNQTVVNSFDPNDITCLEGTSVSTAKVGDYVHYMIRFENTGSASATNIVVKDVVDTAKFDINTIIPMNGSHDYYTRINGNNVEFIFENIYLPFDDANNDGYLAFKIKLKSNLVAGDTFSKNANIYFDYNFPIVTDTATTTIAALSRQDFEFSNYFNLYPNPVHDVLNIATKETIEVSSINIYNMLGQLVLVIPNAQNAKTVDVSSLSSGNYFIKINSNKGTSNTKFIKQ